MKRRLALGLCVLIFASLATLSTASAGAWTQPSGGGYAKFWLHWLPGLIFHAGPESPTPGLQPTGAYQEVGAATWAEMGLAPWLTVTAQWMPVRVFFLEDPRSGTVSTHAGVGDPEVGARVRIISRGRFSSALEVGLRAPLGDGRVVADVYSSEQGHARVGGLVTSPGVWDGRLQVALGVGLPRISVEASGGIIVRSSGFRPLLVWSAQAGSTLGRRRRATGRVRIGAQHPLPLGDAPWGESPSGLGNGTKFFGLTLEIERRINEHWSIGASLATSLGLAARQSHGPAITLYLAHSWGA